MSYIKQYSMMGILILIWGIFSTSFGQNNNVTLLDSSNLYPVSRFWSYSDCWGYTAPDGREYAIIGTFGGTSIVDVTQPTNIVEVAFIPGTTCGFRDMKTYKNYLYVVN